MILLVTVRMTDKNPDPKSHGTISKYGEEAIIAGR